MRSNLTLPLISKRKIIRFPIAIFAAGIIPSQTAVMLFQIPCRAPHVYQWGI